MTGLNISREDHMFPLVILLLKAIKTFLTEQSFRFIAAQCPKIPMCVILYGVLLIV